MGYQVPSVNQCYDFTCVIGQLQAWCCSHAPLVQSVYDECKGTSLSEQVAYLFGVVRDVVKAQQCVDENFKTLYDFVKDFFENLDLQEEVNEWLNHAKNDGTLETIFGNLYQNLKLEIQSIANGSPRGVYDNIDALKLAIPSGNSYIYVTKNDGNWNYWNGSDWVSGGKYIANIINSMGTLITPCIVDLHDESITFYSMENLITATDGINYISLEAKEYTLNLKTEEEYQTLFIGINKIEKTFVATNISHYINNDDVIFFGYVNIQYNYYWINGYTTEYRCYAANNSVIDVLYNINNEQSLYLLNYENSEVNVITPEKVFHINFETLNTDLPEYVQDDKFKISNFILCYNLLTGKFFVVNQTSSLRSTDVVLIGCWYGSIISGVLSDLFIQSVVLDKMIEQANIFALGVSVDWDNTKNITIYGGYDSSHPLNIMLNNGKRIPISSTVDGLIVEFPASNQSVSFYICYDTNDKKIKLFSGRELNNATHKIYLVGYINYISKIISLYGFSLSDNNTVDYYTTAYNALSFVRDTNQQNKVIVFITDLHYNNSPNVIKNTLNLVNDLKKSNLIDAVILGGDYTNGNFSDKQECINTMLSIKNLLPTDIPCFMIRGNHDDNSYYTNSASNVPLSNIVTTSDWINNLIPTTYTHPSNKIYGYYDLDSNNRLVLLDYEDYAVQEESGFLLYNGRNWMGFSDEMLEYLASNVFTNNELNYYIFCHGPYKQSLSAYNYNPINSDKLINLLNSVQTGGSWNEHNFTGFNNNIKFYYSGHNHADLYSYEIDINTIFVSVGASYLLTSALEDSTLLKAGYNRYILRKENSTSEMLFDLVNLDGGRGRIGAGIHSKR